MQQQQLLLERSHRCPLGKQAASSRGSCCPRRISGHRFPKMAALRFQGPASSSSTPSTSGPDAPQASTATRSSHSAYSAPVQPLHNEGRQARQDTPSHPSPSTSSSYEWYSPSPSSSSSTNSTSSFSSRNGSGNVRPTQPAVEQQHHHHRLIDGSSSSGSSSTVSSSSSSSSSSGSHPVNNGTSQQAAENPRSPSVLYPITSDPPRPVSPSSRISFHYQGDDYEPIRSSGVHLLSPVRAALLDPSQRTIPTPTTTTTSSSSPPSSSSPSLSLPISPTTDDVLQRPSPALSPVDRYVDSLLQPPTHLQIPITDRVPQPPTSVVPVPEGILHPPPSVTVLQPSARHSPAEGLASFTTDSFASSTSHASLGDTHASATHATTTTDTHASLVPHPVGSLQEDGGGPAPNTPAEGGGPPPETPQSMTANFLKVWALLVLSATYVHQASTGYSIPIMLPMISTSLSLSDLQGALLTSGYSYLYALALIPAGLLADKQNRPRLLGFSALTWSSFCLWSSQATSFGDLMISRIGLATAQSSQNVICFSMIPDLFPKNKSFALAVYNCAIYVGRGLMFVLITGARSIMFPTQEAGADGSSAMSMASQQTIKDASGNLLVPLDKIDLRLVQIMYTTGDMAAIRAISPFDISDAANVIDLPWLNEQMWRTVLKWIAFPGFLLTMGLLLTVPETRKPPVPPSPPTPTETSSSKISNTSSSSSSGGGNASASLSSMDSWDSGNRGGAGSAALSLSSVDGSSSSLAASASASTTTSGSSNAAATAAAVENVGKPAGVILPEQAGWAGVGQLVQNSAFMSVTMAAALNDVASYALVAWQSTFYERVYGLSTDQYAPVLATLLPVSGILGGVGGGILADKLSVVGKRGYVTVFASLCAAPFIWASVMADDSTQSFAALGVGFALSESWRAPAAVMARSVAPPNMSSTASAIYLSFRNIIGGLGPLAVAQLATMKDLRAALELLPLMYILSGTMFGVAENKLRKLKEQQAAVQQQAELAQQASLDAAGGSSSSNVQESTQQGGAK